MARQYEDQVAVIGMAGRDSVGAMRKFVERHGLGFLPHTVDTNGELWADLRVRVQPTWIFVNGGDGKAAVEFGDFEPDALRARFDRLIAE